MGLLNLRMGFSYTPLKVRKKLISIRKKPTLNPTDKRTLRIYRHLFGESTAFTSDKKQ